MRSGNGVVLILAACAVIAAGAYLLSGRRPETARPSIGGVLPGAAAGFNILLITLDTTRADHLGCYGYKIAQTPVLDGLAAEGIRFDDAVANYPMTLPSHTSILTGLYPPNHAVRNNGEYTLSQEHQTLAELLKGEGYTTAAFISAFVLDARYGLDQGFDIYDGSVDPTATLDVTDVINERSAERVTDAALAWLRERDQSQPFFAWVHYFDPHQPYEAPEPFRSRFSLRPYDAEIAYMDSQIGRLLDVVAEQGLKEKTVYLVVSDHGEGLGDHDESTHGILIYESVMHVPLIIAFPGLFAGPLVVDDAVVSTVDIFPTVLDLLGMSVPPGCDGVSMLRLARHGDRRVYMECMAPYLDNGWAPLFGLRRHLDKYVFAPQREYFDLVNDPRELTNLYINPPAHLIKGRDSLESELDAMLARWPSMEQIADMASILDPISLARLESLGYVKTASPDPSLVTLDPKEMMLVVNKILEAKFLTQQGRHQEALAAIKQALEASPRDRTALHQIARVYLMLDRPKEAEVALREFIAIRPRAQALVLLAQIMIADKQFDEANQLLLQARTLEPKLGMVYVAHGDFALSKGRLREARDSYLHARQVDPYRSGPVVEARLEMLRKHLEELRKRRAGGGGGSDQPQ